MKLDKIIQKEKS